MAKVTKVFALVETCCLCLLLILFKHWRIVHAECCFAYLQGATQPSKELPNCCSCAAPSQPQGFGKVEIQASRREQRQSSQSREQQQAQQLPGVGIGGVTTEAPTWAGIPPHGHALQVFKDSKMIDSIPLTKAMTVFGRYAITHVDLQTSDPSLRGISHFQ